MKDNVIQVIKDQVSLFLNQTGRNADDAKDAVDELIKKLEPDLVTALETGDDMTVQLLRDRVAVEAARVSLELIYKERQTIAAIVSTAVQTAVVIASMA